MERLSGETNLNTSIHRAEQERRAIHGLSYGEMSMVLEDNALRVAKCLRDMRSFIGLECYPAETFVDAVVVVEPNI